MKVSNEGEWRSVFKSFVEGIPRSRHTESLVKAAADAIVAATSASDATRWDTKPYGSTVQVCPPLEAAAARARCGVPRAYWCLHTQALKSLVAVAEDPGTHSLVVRHTMALVVAVMKRRWSEGPAAALAALRLVARLAQEEVVWPPPLLHSSPTLSLLPHTFSHILAHSLPCSCFGSRALNVRHCTSRCRVTSASCVACRCSRRSCRCVTPIVAHQLAWTVRSFDSARPFHASRMGDS
jgi:hypothetical protein